MRYLSLAEALVIAEAVTGIDSAVLARSAGVDLLDSALHAPQAGFGGHDFYPDLVDKAGGPRGQDRPEPSAPRWQQAFGLGMPQHVLRAQRAEPDGHG